MRWHAILTLIWTVFTTLNIYGQKVSQDSLKTRKSSLHDRFIRISMSYGFPQLSYFDEVTESYASSGYSMTSRSKPIVWNASIEKNITREIRIGGTFNYYYQSYVSGSNWKGLGRQAPARHHDITQKLANQSFRIYADYLVVPLDHLDGTRFEFAVGFGFGINHTYLEGRQDFVLIKGISPNIQSVNDTSRHFSHTANVAGASVTTSLDLYLSRNVSLQFKGDFSIYPIVKVPIQQLVYKTSTSGTPVYETITLRQQFFGFSGSIFWMGVHVHI